MELAEARQIFDRLARFEGDAPADAAELLEAIAGAGPRDPIARLLIDEPLVWVAYGLGARGRDVLRGWRRDPESDGADGDDLGAAELTLLVTLDPAAAAVRLRGSRGEEALSVINRFFRGDLDAAIATCEESGWFLDDDEQAHGLFHGLWALGFADRFDEVAEILDRWRERNPDPAPPARALVSRVEAGLASHANRHRQALARIDDAVALCQEHELHLARVYAEATAASVRARAGDLDGAAALIDTWPTALAAGPLAGYRDVARVERALFAGDDAAARDALGDAARTFEDAGNQVMGTYLRLRGVFAARPEDVAGALERFRHAVRAAPIPRFVRALGVLDAWIARLGGVPTRAVLTSRAGPTAVPVARAWVPPLRATEADLFWNRAAGEMHIAGHGPFAVEPRDTAARVLAGVLSAPGFAIPLADLFARVWDMPFDPLRHQNKIHVAIHRLRKWLDERAPGSSRCFEVSDGIARFADAADVAILAVDIS